MWRHKNKKEDAGANGNGAENISPPMESKSTIPVLKEEKKSGGIRKKILKFSGLGHHQSSDGKMSNSELKKLEQTKQFLFKQNSPPHQQPDLPPVDYPSPRNDTKLNDSSSTGQQVREPLRSISPPQSSHHSNDMTQVAMNDFESVSHALNHSAIYANGSSSNGSTAPSLHDFSFGLPKEFNVPGLKLPALATVQIDVREVALRRNAEGDFGFTIRRAPFGNSTVVFAEPVERTVGPPRPSDLANGLLPGDQLLEIDGRPVKGMQREELLQSIQNAQQTIRLKVRVVPELAEICGRASSSDAHIQFGSTSSSNFDGIPENERYWLIHASGYTAARFVENMPDGRANIEVACQQLVVDTQDIDRANPANDDRANDLSALKYLNETTAIHLLRQRQGCGLNFTNAGSNNLIYIANTFNQQNDNSTVNENLIQMFKSCRRHQMPAHIFSSAQQVYRNLQSTTKNQAVAFTGPTATGKSLLTRQFTQFICASAGWSKLLSYKEIEFAFGVLEAFGNCANELNRNASRYVQFLTLGFTNAAALCSAKFQTSLLDVDRLTKHQKLDSTFHVFYYLWEGASDELQKQIHFDAIDRPFFNPLKDQEDRNAAQVGWSHLLGALDKLRLNENQIQGIVNVLGAIFHLMHSGATNNVASRSSFIRTQNAQFAAELLGVTFDQLNLAVFRGNMQQEMSSRFTMTNRSGPEALESFVQCIYNELFSSLTSLINQALDPQKYSPSLTIQLLDVPGSNFFASNKSACGLNDLLYNYLNERLAEMFYKQSFVAPAEFYAREQVNVSVEKPLITPERCTRLLDLKQQLLNSADVDRRAEEQRGLLYILEEESVFPGAQDVSFLERIFIHCENSRIVKRSPRGKLQFVLGHSHNSAPTTYSVEGWLKQAQPSHAVTVVPKLLQDSTLEPILELFTITPLNRVETSMKLRRATQSVNDVAGARSFGGFFSNIAIQLDHIFNTIERAARIQFVHCIQSHRPDTISSSLPSDVLDVGYVRQQMRSYLLVDSIRTSIHGYPERLPFKDFRRRFQCLVPKSQQSLNDALDDRSATQRILQSSEIGEHFYRLGISQILLRTDVLIELEQKRDLCLSGLIVGLQVQCRRHLAYRWLEKKRLQEQAVKCLQRNINIHVQLRQWPWWRLYINVLPLLNQARSDEHEREWRDKLKRSEQMNNELRLEKNRLDAQIGEMEQIYKTESQTTQYLTESLERENEKRVQLEAELRALKQKLQKQKG